MKGRCCLQFISKKSFVGDELYPLFVCFYPPQGQNLAMGMGHGLLVLGHWEVGVAQHVLGVGQWALSLVQRVFVFEYWVMGIGLQVLGIGH